MSATAESVENLPRSAVPGAARTIGRAASSASWPRGCRPRRTPDRCTRPCATACSAAASACDRRSCTRRRAHSAFPNPASMAPPARWNSFTPTRSCTTICRRWTTTTCAAAGRPATRRSMKRPRSWSATRCRCSRFEMLASGPGLPDDAAIRLRARRAARASAAARRAWPAARRSISRPSGGNFRSPKSKRCTRARPAR